MLEAAISKKRSIYSFFFNQTVFVLNRNSSDQCHSDLDLQGTELVAGIDLMSMWLIVASTV